MCSKQKKWRHKTYDIAIMRPTPLVPTFMMFFQILVNFIAFVIGCDYSVTYSIRRWIQGIGDYAAYYAMKRIMQNTCIFWWLPSMHTQLMRRHHSYELSFMHNWEVHAILWWLPSCVINNIRLWRLWSMGTVHKSEAPLGGRLPLCVLRKLKVCPFWGDYLYLEDPHHTMVFFWKACPMGH